MEKQETPDTTQTPMPEPTIPEADLNKTDSINEEEKSSMFDDDLVKGTKLVATRTATTTATALVGQNAKHALSTTTSTALGHSSTFIATSVGQSVLAGGMSSIGAIGGAIFSKDKKRALARGVPSVIIALIPGIGIPLAIGANVVSGLVVDKIYTMIQNKHYFDLSLFIPESVCSSLDSLISKITKKLNMISANFIMIKSSDWDMSRVFVIAGKFKKRQKMFEKAVDEKFKITTESNFGEYLLMARELFREKVIDISDATKEVDEVIEHLEKYLALLTSNDDNDNLKSYKKAHRKDVKVTTDVINALKPLNEELKEKISNELKNGLEKYELFVASEMQRMASQDDDNKNPETSEA